MPTLAEIGSFLGTIPETFWGVLLGSSTSIIVVSLTNRASDKRLSAQLDHERQRKFEENDLQLRTEVYVEAIEAIQAGIMQISQLANLDAPLSTINERYAEKSPAIAKAKIVGNEQTVSAINDLSIETAAAFLNLSTKRIKADAKKSEIEALDTQIAKSGEERDQMLALMKRYNLSGEQDQILWNTITSGFEFEQKRVSEGLAERQQLASELVDIQISLAEKCASESMNLGEIGIPVVLAIRRELNIATDVSFERLSYETNKRMSEIFSSFLKELRSFLHQEQEKHQDGNSTESSD